MKGQLQVVVPWPDPSRRGLAKYCGLFFNLEIKCKR